MNQVATLESIHADLSSALTRQGIQSLLPAHVSPEQFTRTAATALVADPELQNADRQSLVMSLIRCAQDGLVPDGREAAMVVYNTKQGDQWVKKAQYLPMVDGVLKRARQSGQVANITGKVVHMADKFDYWVDENGEHIEHRPAFENHGEIRLVYAFAKLTSGEIVVEVMSRSEVEKVRDATAKKDRDGKPKVPAVWQKWFDRMALKTVLHRLARRLPCASELYSLLDVNQIVDEAEKPLSVAHSAKSRPRLRDALGKMKFGQPAVKQNSETVHEAEFTESQQNPALEAALNALDDVTDEKSYTEVAGHCTSLAARLTEAEKAGLREKLQQTKARIEHARRRL